MESIKKIAFVFDNKQKLSFALVFIAIVINAFLETLGVTILIPFINAILSPEDLFENRIIITLSSILNIQNSKQLVVFLTVVVILVYVLKDIYLLWVNNIQYRYIYNNQKKLSYRMLKSYLEEPYLFHTKHNSAELRNNVLMDVDTFFVTLLNVLQLLTEVLVSLSLIVVMFIVDKTMSFGLVLLIGSILLFFARIYKNRVKMFGEGRRRCSIEMSKWLDQSLGGIKEIKILNREGFFLDSYEKANIEYVRNRRKYTFYSTAPKPVLESACIISLLGIVIIKILRGVAVEYFLMTLTVFVGAAFKILPSVSKIASYASTIIYNKSSIDAIYNDLKEIDDRNKEESNIETNTCMEFSFNECIYIKDLCFKYPDAEEMVLKSVNLMIPKNKSVALVGASGSGKTTLADILLGVLTPSNGKVLVDGMDISRNMCLWQKKLGYIPQNIYLMDDTIRNNIAFGEPEDEIDDSKIWDALEGAQLKSFVENLENGLDTVIGERGARISGGQRQRIGIARALYRNSEVLVLDEATSALDNDTERAVMGAIDALNGTKTMIVIAHRLSTIENCDTVFEIKNGYANKIKG